MPFHPSNVSATGGDASAANQTSEINLLTTIDVDTGSIATSSSASATSLDVIEANTTGLAQTVKVDDDVFNVASDRVIAVGLIADETSPDSVGEGDIGIARMTLDRKQLTASEQILGTATYTEATTYGSIIGAVRNDTLATLASVDNEIAPLQVDANGAVYVNLATTIDATNDAISTQPVEPSNINTTALAASLVVKASAGTLYEVRGHNDLVSSQYILVHDAASLPADTAVPEDVILVPGDSNFSITYPQGKSFGTGIVVCNSSTLATKTIGTTNCWFSCEFL